MNISAQLAFLRRNIPTMLPDTTDTDQPFSLISDASFTSDIGFSSECPSCDTRSIANSIAQNELVDADTNGDNLKINTAYSISLSLQSNLKIKSELTDALFSDNQVITNEQHKSVSSKPDELGIDRRHNCIFRDTDLFQDPQNWWISKDYYVDHETDTDDDKEEEEEEYICIEFEYHPMFIDYGVCV